MWRWIELVPILFGSRSAPCRPLRHRIYCQLLRGVKDRASELLTTVDLSLSFA